MTDLPVKVDTMNDHALQTILPLLTHSPKGTMTQGDRRWETVLDKSLQSNTLTMTFAVVILFLRIYPKN